MQVSDDRPESSQRPSTNTADAADSTRAAPSLGWAVHLCGAVIVASAALPVTTDGRSFAALLLAEFERGLLEGFMMLAGFGSPFLFGLAITVVALPQLRSLAIELVRTPIGLMHGQLLLVAFVVWRNGEAVGGAGLFGFAVIGAIAYARSGTRAPGGHALGLAGIVRWGAIMVAGVAAWCRLQRLADVHLGLAVDVILGAALLLVVLSSRTAKPAVAPPA